MPDTKDKRGNELSPKNQIVAGILLIIFTLFPIWLILAFWPDQIPEPRDNIKPLYIKEIYHVRLAGIKNSACCADSFLIYSSSGSPASKPLKDSADSAAAKMSSEKDGTQSISDTVNKPIPRYINQNKLIGLNTIVLILVAAGGFLGNMIHIASSFTNFIGAGQFKRSWLLWYFVKPMTASAMAIALYFVFRGGFLNYGADAASINLYGMLTISILAGLFTDRASLKLSEIFDVIFSLKKDLKSDDSRPNKLEPNKPKILSVNLDSLTENIENVITLSGQQLTSKSFSVAINGEPVAVSDLTADTVTIKYTIPSSQKDKDDFVLELKDVDSNLIYTNSFKKIKIKPAESNSEAKAAQQIKKEVTDDETNDNDDDNDSFVKG